MQYLQGLPVVCPDVTRLGPNALLSRLRKGLAAVGDSNTTSGDAIKLSVPYWLYHDYGLCVLCEAVSYSSSLPAVFYLDSLRSAAMSLVHKDTHVVSSGNVSRMRPWVCGVGDPETGKSHAADPHLAIPEEVCRGNEAYAVGAQDDGFHAMRSRTYAAFEHKLAQTAGYGIMITGEGHTLLSPTYPARGYFDDQKGLRFDKLIETSYGGSFGGETKTDREKAQRARKKGDEVYVPFQRRTNVCFSFIIQDSVWIDWFVLAESQHHEGLVEHT
jgi:hypothetical protein